jgi:cyclophilin family peptidyl-prolyl cis-trans isomerase
VTPSSLRLAPFLLLVCAVSTSARAENPFVRMATPLGSITVELCAEPSTVCAGDAPNTVANFLRYVDEMPYPDTMFVHRRGLGGPSPIVIQGGTFWVNAVPTVANVPTFAPIALELDENLSNVRGSIAMARSAALDSATSGWFINVVDNVNLDTSGGGYAVFGHVVAGIAVVDDIAALTIYNLGAPFGELPLIDYPGGGASVLPHLVYVPEVVRVPEPGAPGGVALLSLWALAARRRAS